MRQPSGKWRKPGGRGDRYTTIRRRWPWPRVIWWVAAVTVILIVIGLAATMGGCGVFGPRQSAVPDAVLPVVELPPTVAPQAAPEPEEVLGSAIAQILWMVRPLLGLIVLAWALAAWLPWLSMRFAIGATCGLGGLIVLAWLMAYLAKYGDWIIVILVAGFAGLVVWLGYPLAKAWRKRVAYTVAKSNIEGGFPGLGETILATAKIPYTNGKGTVRIGWPRRERVKIGAKQQQRGDI